MTVDFQDTLTALSLSGNLRSIPSGATPAGVTDLSTNDYLGLAARLDLQERFLNDCAQASGQLMTSSASRLLASSQEAFSGLENKLSGLYRGRAALLFNSGYHANTGLVSALASGGDTVVIADKLIHASAIDGIALSRAPFERFRHNDLRHLSRLLEKHRSAQRILVIVESIYSMDGDSAPIDALIDLKRSFPQMMLFVDEAHALGVAGPGGLGLCAASGRMDEVDVIVGTFGKALASSGAFCIVSPVVREFLVNRARSLIFSTAIPPLCALWTSLMLDTMLGMDAERAHLRALAAALQCRLQPLSPEFPIPASHIQPLVIGNAAMTVNLSTRLLGEGFKVLPIRTPTVPPGTERLRISLSAALSLYSVERLADCITNSLAPCKA